VSGTLGFRSRGLVSTLRLDELLQWTLGGLFRFGRGNRRSREVKSDLLKVSRGEISGPAQIAFEHLVPLSTIGIPIRPCAASGFLAYDELAMLAGKGEGGNAAHPGEPLRTARSERERVLMVLSLTKRIEPVIGNPGETVPCSLWQCRWTS
jgi:hypothetical protein